MNPETSNDYRFGDADGTPTSWATAEEMLDSAEVFWISTVRRDGRQNVVTLLAVWVDDALYFATGKDEQKGVNLRENDHVALTTGCNLFSEGIDLVVEGTAVRVTETAELQRVADRYKSNYDWTYTVGDGDFVQKEGNRPWVFRVTPETAFGFKKGKPFGQTRWRFGK